MKKQTIVLLILIGSNLIHTAAFNQPSASQQEYIYIALKNDTNETLHVNPETSILSSQVDFLQLPAGTTIQNLLSRINIGERTFQVLPPIALGAPLQNNTSLTFTNNANPEIIDCTTGTPYQFIAQPLLLENAYVKDSDDSSEYSESEEYDFDSDDSSEYDESEEYDDDDTAVHSAAAAA